MTGAVVASSKPPAKMPFQKLNQITPSQLSISASITNIKPIDQKKATNNPLVREK